jgi:hypothetical protein
LARWYIKGEKSIRLERIANQKTRSERPFP